MCRRLLLPGLVLLLTALPLFGGVGQHRGGHAFLTNQRRQAWPIHHRVWGARQQQLPRRNLGNALERLHQLPLPEQLQRLQQDPGFQRLPPQRQQRIVDRLRWFNSLPPDKQRKVLTRLHHLGELTPVQRQGLTRVFQAWKTFPLERRRAFRRAFHQLNRMAPEKQQQALASRPYQSRFSPQEIDLLHQALDLRLPQDVIGSRPPENRPSP